MAYREVGMVEVREIVRRWLAGDGLRSIARALGVDRKTVAEYVRRAHAAGLERGGAPPSEAQFVALATCRRPGRPVATTEPSAEVRALVAHQETIRRWLSEDGLRLTKVYRRLRAQGVAVSYSTLYRFARAQCDFAPAAITVRVAEPPPGEAAEVDFGLLGLWLDPLTAQRRRVYGLLVTLCFSRYAFLGISLGQDLAAVLDGLEAAWAFFQGVVHRLVSDNLKPVVTRADRYTPTIDRVFLEYAQFRGFMLDPAVVRHPTGKPKVERGIPYCREDFFRGETFRDLAEMQARAVVWSREIAGTRLHGTTRQVPRVVFEAVEQPTLLPLSPEPFDRPTWAAATVHPDHHIQFHRALYSVPTRYIGQRVDVRGDSRVVRIYHRGELIKVHVPQLPGRRATDYVDYPAERAPYAMRAPDACIRQAERCACGSSGGSACGAGGVMAWGRGAGAGARGRGGR